MEGGQWGALGAAGSEAQVLTVLPLEARDGQDWPWDVGSEASNVDDADVGGFLGRLS